jgi:hypothetical protein
MAIRADHVALCDLVEDGLPITRSDPSGNGELLAAEVIELKNDWVRLAAVGARVLAEELKEKGRAFCDQCVLPTRRRGKVTLPVREVVRSFVGGATPAAICVECSERPSVPRELRRRLQLPANAAALARAVVRHEHMFPRRADRSIARESRHPKRKMTAPRPLSAAAGVMASGTRDSDDAWVSRRRRIGAHRGEWRSLVAHPAGGRAVAGSNPVSPTNEWPANSGFPMLVRHRTKWALGSNLRSDAQSGARRRPPVGGSLIGQHAPGLGARFSSAECPGRSPSLASRTRRRGAVRFSSSLYEGDDGCQRDSGLEPGDCRIVGRGGVGLTALSGRTGPIAALLARLRSDELRIGVPARSAEVFATYRCAQDSRWSNPAVSRSPAGYARSLCAERAYTVDVSRPDTQADTSGAWSSARFMVARAFQAQGKPP